MRSGRIVYAFRDAGFQALGFDIHDYLELRGTGDRQYFEIANKGGDKSDFSLDWTRYRLPYSDGTFDLVLSGQVMEHVQDHDAVLRELARITKPQGLTIHIFPPRYRAIEAHTYVPFGGMTKAKWYFLLWAALGIRNEFQKGLSATETATRNVRYAHTGTNYLSLHKLREIGKRYFEVSHFDARSWHIACGSPGWRLTRPALTAFLLFSEIVWILEKPRQSVANLTRVTK
jgi:SAM-dependent methyltransferase